MKRGIVGGVCIVSFLALALLGCSRDPSVRKRKYLESGQRYFEKGKYQEAIIQFSNAVQVDPRYGDPHYQLARVYTQLQQWQPAYQELSRTVELQPDNYGARIEMVSMLISARQFKQAQQHVDFLLHNQSENPVVHAMAADLLTGQNNFLSAIQETQKAIALDPSRWQSYLQLASEQVNAGEASAAEPSFRKAVELNPAGSTARLALAQYYQSRQRFGEAEQQVQAAIAGNSKDPERRAALVRLYMSQGKKDQALLFLKNIKNDFPENSVGYRLLGDFFFAIGDIENATTEYAALYRAHAGDPVVKRNFIQLLILNNRVDEAEKLNNEILKAKPDDAVALTCKGQIELHHGQSQRAVDTLRAALKSDPDNVQTLYQLGVAFERLGDLAHSENAWQNAVQRNPDFSEGHLALARCALRRNDMPSLEQASSEVIRLLPSSPSGYAMRALSLLRRNQFSRAEQDATHAIRLAPQAPDGYMQMGNIRMAQKNFAEAANFFHQALDRDSTSSEALASLMNVYVTQGHVDKALAAAQGQISRVPDNSVFYDLLGTSQFDHRKTNRDLEEAETAFQKSTQLDKRNADAWLKLSQVQAARGEVEDAIQTAERGLEDNPQQLPLYLLMGKLYEFKHNLDKAKQCYQAALELNPQNPQASNDMAFLLTLNGGNLDVALSLAQTARRGMPDSPNAADTLGWVLYQKRAYKSAIEAFRQAIDLTQKSRSHESPTFHFHLGLAYQRDGQATLARQQLQQVLKIDPNYSMAEDVKKLLEQLHG